MNQQSWSPTDLKNSSQWITNTDDITSIRHQILNELENGYGVFLIRNFPIGQHTVDQIKSLYFKLGTELGTPVNQDSQGTKVIDIRSTDAKLQNALHYQLKSDGSNTRPYETNVAFSFHSDPCDVAGLLCLHNAAKGGENRIVSAIALHDAIAEKNPDLLSALYESYYYVKPPKKNRQLEYHQIPIFSDYKGYFKCHVVPELIRASQTYPEVPRLTKLQIEALAYLEKLANDSAFYYELTLTPGDLLLINNHVVLHARNAYEEGSQRRHLLRLWLAVPNSRPLDPIHQDWFGNINPGEVRGGYYRK